MVDGLQTATPEEAAAVMAAIARFVAETTPVASGEPPRIGGWQRAALLEGVGRDPDAPSPWGDPIPWG